MSGRDSTHSTHRTMLETPREQTDLATLFAQHRDRLQRVIRFRMDERLRGRLDTSDVLQDVFLDASQRFEHFVKNPNYPFMLWIREIAIQRLIGHYRQHVEAQKRSIQSEAGHSESANSSAREEVDVHKLSDSITSPSQLLSRQEQAARLHGVLASMNANDQEVLALRHFEELTNDEVAEVLGLSKAAASNRYVRALGRLKELLDSQSNPSAIRELL